MAYNVNPRTWGASSADQSTYGNPSLQSRLHGDTAYEPDVEVQGSTDETVCANPPRSTSRASRSYSREPNATPNAGKP